jgi:hypothetical protein
MNITISKALDELVRLIAGGAEYPDAHSAVVCSHGLSDHEAAELAHEYDKQDQRGAA